MNSYIVLDTRNGKIMFGETIFDSINEAIEQVVSYFAIEFPEDEEKIRNAFKNGEELHGIGIVGFPAFKNAEDFQKHIREFNKCPDNVIVDNVIFTMDEYDLKGKTITYGNIVVSKQLEIVTKNRYKNEENGFDDAVVKEQTLMSYRNDISYLAH